MAIQLHFCIETTTSLHSFLKKEGFSDVLLASYKKKPFAFLKDVPLLLDASLQKGATICVILSEEINKIPPIEKELNIVYEDAYLLVIDKPKNVATLGTGSHFAYNLAGMVSYYYQQRGIHSKIHFVNRLDLQTSGLTLLAKHQYIHALFSKRVEIEKKYYALVCGHPSFENGYIQEKIARPDPRSIKRVIAENGQEALTHYQLIRYIQEDSLLDITLHTGRTHQIRVHMASIGHPLVGDVLYGGRQDENFCLKSYYLSFIHPILKKRLTFTLPPFE